jgi:ATP-binding cassette subfamily F protein 3
VANETLTAYAGNYSFYKEEKKLRMELQQNAFDNQQQMIKQTEKFIERFRAKATKSNQVQSRIKALDRLDRVHEVVNDEAFVNFKFKFSQKSGRDVITLEKVSKAYGDLTILKNTAGRIERGDKIALIGANGKGKSTLLRIIAGTEVGQGSRVEGHNLIKAFFAQHQLEALTLDNEIIQEMSQAGSKKTEMELRGVLGCFLFSNEEVYKKIKVLSGGEKSRVALAKTLISEANFLLLDEPTNHLDFQSVNILIQALQQYEGTFITVSHDRHFIKGVANKIWYIEEHEIKEYPGTYDEYEFWRSQQVAVKPVAVVEKVVKTPILTPKSTEEAQQAKRELKKLEEQLQKIEKEITQIEGEKLALEEQLADPALYADEVAVAKVQSRYQVVQSSLQTANSSWEGIVDQISLFQTQLA